MLNKQTGNMYNFVTHTWNTVKGQCPHDCSYCYMKRWGKQKPVHFDEKELKTDLGQGNYIFVGSSCDLFADDIPDEWIVKTLEYCKSYDNNYLFQSKNPIRMLKIIAKFGFPKKSIVCTTIETNRTSIYRDILGSCPLAKDRAEALRLINTAFGFKTMVTIEPVIDFDFMPFYEIIKRCNPVQVNIGADSGNNNLPEPVKDKLKDFIQILGNVTRLHQKDNIKRLLK